MAYKVLGGGMTLAEMKNNAWEEDDLDGRGSLQHPDWQAIYMQFQRSHVLGTVPYRWESQVMDYKEAQLMEVTFEDLKIVSLDGSVFHDASVSADDKARAAKLALQIQDGLLMQRLGEMGKVALVRETEDEWELLVPHCLLAHLTFRERVLVRWKKHMQMPVTDKWCDASQPAVWMQWREGMEPDCIPDLPVFGATEVSDMASPQGEAEVGAIEQSCLG